MTILPKHAAVITIRLSTADRDVIIARAKRLNMTLSAYARQSMLGFSSGPAERQPEPPSPPQNRPRALGSTNPALAKFLSSATDTEPA